MKKIKQLLILKKRKNNNTQFRLFETESASVVVDYCEMSDR